MYQQVCSVYGCGTEYLSVSKYSVCPVCMISERDIEVAGTNDREAIINKLISVVCRDMHISIPLKED